MKQSIRLWLSVFLFVACASWSVAAEDDGGNYSGGWTNLSNGGTGFGPWELTTGGDSTATIADPADSGITGMSATSFRLTGTTGYVDANRNFANPLSIGDTFRIQWGNNWDTGGGNKGINLYSGGHGAPELMNINMGNSDTITIDGSPMFTNYGVAAITFNFEYQSVNTLRVFATGRDGVETFDDTITISGAPDAFRLYAGDMQADTNRYVYANNLEILDGGLLVLTVSGADGMAVGMTNLVTVTRSGDTSAALLVDLDSDDAGVVTVPVDVTIPIGESSAEFEAVAVGGGVATITATAVDFTDGTLEVGVFDIAYDDSWYYEPGTWTNASNGGLGFGPWTLINNNGPAEGYTNHAGAFLGSSISGGPNVNSPSGNAFGLYANSEGEGDALSEAMRGFDDLGVGESITFLMGVNFRNGSKGASLWYDDGEDLSQLLEVAVYEDGYWYQNHSQSEAAVELDTWAYAADSAIEVTVSRHDATTYSLLIERHGSAPDEELINNITLDNPPNTIRFYVFEAEGGDQNNLYFNDIGIFTGVVGEIEPEAPQLNLLGIDAMALFTNEFTVVRTGPTGDALTVNLDSSDVGVLTVPVSVIIPVAEDSVTFDVVGVGLGSAIITASAVDFDNVTFNVDVYDIAYDDTQYYAPTFDWIDASNGGGGFGAWVLSENAGENEGYTNYVGFFIGDSTSGGPDVNSAAGNAFGMYANSDGDGDAEASARRTLDELGIGESMSFEVGVNFRNGSKGAVIQSGTDWLFEIAVYADDYWVQNHSLGQAPVSLGWDYAADSAIHVILSRHDATTYSVSIERSGSTPQSEIINNVVLNDAPDAIRFYVFDADAGGDENNLYVNSLAIYTGTIGSIDPELSFSNTRDAMAFFTNVFTVSRTGPTDSVLTVNLESSDTDVLTVPAEAVIALDDASITFEVVGVGIGSATITASAVGFGPILYDVDVVADIAYDDTMYYGGSWDDASNGGGGFGAWALTDNGDGIDSFTGFFLGGSLVNAGDNRSFGMYANGVNDPLAEAVRPFDEPWGVGESVSFRMAINFRNGAKGVMFQNGGDWLFEIAVFSDDYSYNIRDLMADDPVSLGWAYAADTVIEVTLSRVTADTYNVLIERGGSDPQSTLLTGVTLSEPPDRVRFYVFDTNDGDEANNLYVNNLAIRTGIVEGEDDDRPVILDFGPDGVTGEPTVTIAVGAAGVTYRLYYTTNLTEDPLSWTLVATALGNGVDPVELVDDDLADDMRIYGLTVEE